MLSKLMSLTEIGMLLYWLLATAMALGIVTIPPEYMYSDHQNPLVIAWNWSFLPIDVAFALLGLASRFAGLTKAVAAKLSLMGATLMMCAGVMAISFWVINGDFDPVWWGMNLWLCGLSMVAILSMLKARSA